jgi:hypothetical protein
MSEQRSAAEPRSVTGMSEQRSAAEPRSVTGMTRASHALVTYGHSDESPVTAMVSRSFAQGERVTSGTSGRRAP